MKKKTLLIILISILFFLLINIFFIYYSYKEKSEIKTCIDINNMDLFEYDACYDAFSGNIFFELKTLDTSYNVNQIDIQFFDFFDKSYSIKNLPRIGQSSSLKIPAKRNPLTLKLFLISENINSCSSPRYFSLNYCPAELSSGERNITLNLINNVSLNDFSDLENSNPSDNLDSGFVNFEKVWESICEPNWVCEEWGECIDGSQRRECVDEKNCSFRINLPSRIRQCNQSCTEKWICTWSKCVDGFSTPTCIDENNCGTEINRPQKIPCNKECIPKIQCTNWSMCNVNYDFLTLSNNEYSYNGIQTRTCIDTNKCLNPTIEQKNCSLVMDVFSQPYTKCGREYIGIYNKLNNELIASIEKGSLNEPFLNIDLSNKQTKRYCDHCFDGIKNGDETEIDCGGSCLSCTERIVISDYGITLFGRIIDGFLKFIS